MAESSGQYRMAGLLSQVGKTQLADGLILTMAPTIVTPLSFPLQRSEAVGFQQLS